MIYRDLKDAILENFKYFPVITLTGPRQSGKTTLIREVFKDLSYYSMENIDNQDFASNDPIGFLNQDHQGMILDEVQNTPHLMSYIQGIVDEHPERRFILSGSAQFSLMNSITQSLAGRSAVLELLPLSLNEIKDSLPNQSADSLIFNGFYPAIHAGKNVSKLFYPAYTKTYLERDVRQLLQIKDMRAFQVFLRLCAGRIGSLFNSSELSNEVGVAVNTVKSWLSLLQASYIVTLLPPYFENSRKRLTKTPKLYFYDTGLAAYLLSIENEQQLNHDKMRGHLFENMVVIEFVKNAYNNGKSGNLTFYRDSNGNEIDLLVAKGGSYTAIEIKSAQTYNSEFEKGLKSASPELESKIAEKAIIYAGDYENTAAKIKLLNFKNKTTYFFHTSQIFRNFAAKTIKQFNSQQFNKYEKRRENL